MEVLNKEKVLEHAKRLIDEGKFERAIVEYRRLLEVDPRDMRIKLRVAELLVRQKKISEAVKVYNEVADSYTADGFYLKAVTVYKGILRLNPSLIDINYRMAELYEKMGLAKDATHQYQILASALEQKGDTNGLIEVRRKMVELNPHNIANRMRLAETYQYQGMEKEAIDEYEKLVDEVRASGKTEDLIELYEKVLAYRPDNIDMLKSLCSIYYKRGEWKRVVAHFDKKESVPVSDAELLMMQADSYGHLNQIETAKSRYQSAANIFIERGEIDKALDAYKEILVLSPADEESVRELVSEIDADYFEKVKSLAEEKRKRIEERAIAKAKEDVSAAGEVILESQKDEDTMFLYSADEIDGKLREADAAFELGKAYRTMGLEAEAAPELERALNIYQGLERSGHREEVVLSRIGQLKELFGLRDPNTALSERQRVEVSEACPKRTSTSQSVRSPKSEVISPKSKEQETKKGINRKKSDKRMGFV